jgi:hypothetical protein
MKTLFNHFHLFYFSITYIINSHFNTVLIYLSRSSMFLFLVGLTKISILISCFFLVYDLDAPHSKGSLI